MVGGEGGAVKTNILLRQRKRWKTCHRPESIGPLIRSSLYSAMSKIRTAAIAAFLFALPLQAQVRRGSLVVWIVSKRADYVVIGAESRTLDKTGRPIDDRSCKIISLGGDTLFLETGAAEIGVYHGKPWNSKAVARTVYTSTQNRDALRLSNAWGARALRWFGQQPEQDLRALAYGSGGDLVTGAFITFDRSGKPSSETMEISYNTAKHSLTSQPSTQTPGQIGMTGVGLDLAKEFFAGRTERAVRAFGPVGVLRSTAIDSMEDVRNVQKAIKFAIDNSVGEEKAFLGGDIDVAIIRKDRTIEWVARKSMCSQQDLKPTPLLKKK